MYEDILLELIESQKEKINTPLSPTRNESIEYEDGYVWIENGVVRIKDPIGNGRVPSIISCDGLRLIINGSEIRDMVFVKESDEIQVKFEYEERDGGFDLEILEDRLCAKITLKMGYSVDKSLKDANPSISLNLSVEKTLTKKGWGFTYKDITTYLEKKGIVFGIDLDKLKDKYENCIEGTFVIAEGVPPTGSTDEVVEILFPTEDSLFTDEISTIQKVNFREISSIISVSTGDVIAVKHKAQRGKEGRAVTGEIIPPNEPKQITLEAGNGTQIIDNGFRVIASLDGSPKVKSHGQLRKFTVDPQLVHKGDVDSSTGNLRFKGSIKVLGSIVDYALVDATEDVMITGSVDNAKVKAGKNICVEGKVISSTVRAGGIGAYCNSLLPYMKSISDILKDMREALLQVLESSVSRGLVVNEKVFGQIVLMLKDKKFVNLNKNVQAFTELVLSTEEQLPQEIEIIAEEFENFFRGLKYLSIGSMAKFDDINEKLHIAYSITKQLTELKAHISIDYAHNSRISASGDVYVKGQGCFTTVIYSGGNTKINGVFRGGQIYSNGNVFIHELGVEAGTRTEVQVPKDKVISLNTVYEDIYIKIGRRRYRFDAPASNVLAKLDENGNLVIKGFPLNGNQKVI